jgi:hypothetical protein
MEGFSFEGWLEAAGVSSKRLNEQQLGILQGAFSFLEECGGDFATQRILAHFLLHCHSGLKIAQIGRLVGLSRQVTSRQRKLSSRQVIQEVHHRFSGRPYGKLLPRYAGSIAEFLITRPQASQYDLLDFIERTWEKRVSRQALSRFLKKYGLDKASRIQAVSAAERASSEATSSSENVESGEATNSTADGAGSLIVVHDAPWTKPGMVMPPEKFFLAGATMPVGFSCCQRPSTG